MRYYLFYVFVYVSVYDLLYFNLFVASSTVSKSYGRFGNVKVFFNGPVLQQNWPSGIELLNNIQSGTIIIGSSSSSSSSTRTSTVAEQAQSTIRQRVIKPQRRIFTWSKDHLQISLNVTALSVNAVTSQLNPPIAWITSGAFVRALDKDCTVSERIEVEKSVKASASDGTIASTSSSSSPSSSGFVDIIVSRNSAENALSTLRACGFNKEDIYRILDKGPWIFAFDYTKCLSKLIHDLQSELDIHQSDAVHIVSHCPYLIAQYSKYKGRDVTSTILALLDIGFTVDDLKNDVMRFPSILAAPQDRLRGWMSLFHGHNIAVRKGHFAKLLRRSPFMYQIDPPALIDITSSPSSLSSQSMGVSGVHNVINVLQALQSHRLKDIDKLVRTCPEIILASAEDISERLDFLRSLFLVDDITGDDASDSSISGSSSVDIFTNSNNDASSNRYISKIGSISSGSGHSMVSSLLESSPKVVLIQVEQMRLACNALRAAGLKRTEVIQLVKRYPPILSRDVVEMKDLISFIKYQCGLRKHDVAPFLYKCPNILDLSVVTAEAKIEYLYQCLGGSPMMLRNVPQYLLYDLNLYIRPRSEFLRAMGIEPLFRGLLFLVTATQKDVAYAAGVREEVLKKFCYAYNELMEKQNYDLYNKK